MTKNTISVGQFTVYGFRDGFFYLDGGSMFGVVPKVLWEKIYTPDDKNRIQMGLNSLLVQTKQDLILIETGIGRELDPKVSQFYSVEQNPGLLGELKNLRFEPEDIDIVINTHLHFDHCGGNTYRNEKGEFVPTFPNAEYVIQKGEWDYALHPSLRDKSSYIRENFVPLEKNGLVRLVDGDTEITQGVEVVLASGHTSRHQCVKVTSEGEVLFFLGDLVPMSGHVGLSYIMSYDLFPLDTLKNKMRYFDQAIAEDWRVAFVHDPHFFFGKVGKKDYKYVFQNFEEND
jgi:glyoxylase-like metal-dependent hydrolase (beta-lactamase superfamily II)